VAIADAAGRIVPELAIVANKKADNIHGMDETVFIMRPDVFLFVQNNYPY
jgi:hypothetical protein